MTLFEICVISLVFLLENFALQKQILVFQLQFFERTLESVLAGENSKKKSFLESAKKISISTSRLLKHGIEYGLRISPFNLMEICHDWNVQILKTDLNCRINYLNFSFTVFLDFVSRSLKYFMLLHKWMHCKKLLINRFIVHFQFSVELHDKNQPRQSEDKSSINEA